jgi:hypothetical protein
MDAPAGPARAPGWLGQAATFWRRPEIGAAELGDTVLNSKHDRRVPELARFAKAVPERMRSDCDKKPASWYGRVENWLGCPPIRQRRNDRPRTSKATTNASRDAGAIPAASNSCLINRFSAKAYVDIGRGLVSLRLQSLAQSCSTANAGTPVDLSACGY